METRQLHDYKATEILTADPAKIILMLYDGAIRFMYQAAEAADEKNHLERASKITRTNNILLELLSSLDMEQGGEIAENLREIYVFLVKELLSADRENDAVRIRRCANVLEEIREGWSSLVQPAIDRSMAEIRNTYSSLA